MTHTPNTLPPLPQPWDYCYEWNGPYGTRKFSVAPHNGRKPDATVQVYTADQMQAYARAALAQSAQAPAPEATLRLELEFDGEQQPIEIVAHGTDTHMRRLKARINYWLSLEKAAQAPVPAQRLTAEHVKFILEAVPDIGDAQAREWAIARAVEREALSIDAPAAPAQPAPSVEAVTLAARDVLAERQRQVSVEGWTPEHDDEHSESEMALAAACYALSAGGYAKGQVPPMWPWSMAWWKPAYGRRDLVRAAALILAEIERLDRAEALARGAR